MRNNTLVTQRNRAQQPARLRWLNNTAQSYEIWNDGRRIFAMTMPTEQEIARACATMLVAADFVFGDR